MFQDVPSRCLSQSLDVYMYICYTYMWVSDKIRYDQSSIKRVVVLPSVQTHSRGPPSNDTQKDTLRKVGPRCTAKPIGAHPTLGCPFGMYQILLVTHISIYIYIYIINTSNKQVTWSISMHHIFFLICIYVFSNIFSYLHIHIHIYLCVFIYTYFLCIYIYIIKFIYQTNRACCPTWQLCHSPSDLLHLSWGPLQALGTLCIRGGETLKGPMPVIWKKHLPLICPPPNENNSVMYNADMFSQKDVRMFESLDVSPWKLSDLVMIWT